MSLNFTVFLPTTKWFLLWLNSGEFFPIVDGIIIIMQISFWKIPIFPEIKKDFINVFNHTLIGLLS
jgi:hypothetical protein